MRQIISAIIALSVLASCTKAPKWKGSRKQAGDTPQEMMLPSASETGDLAPPAPGMDLVWKRYRAFEDGIVQGLSLNKSDFCLELGKQPCIDKTHLTVLGGNEPYESGQYERVQSPTVLTAVAVDRIVLSACSKRLELDRAADAKAIVFKHFSLKGSAPDPKQIADQTTELYRRLLARNAEAEEVKIIQGMTAQNLPPDKLALIMCFAIATSIENILL